MPTRCSRFMVLLLRAGVSWGSKDDKRDQFDFPSGIAVHDDKVYVVDEFK
jgi:hypothetical protein